ncbi:protein MONOCULM 1 [Oryza sativa Japonica Group]|uniref:OSJNBa0084A10.13 protein n=2 Tax=Oryza sativa TaxID=4530 RepID=Q7XQP2_ORYSJ|nr:Os04g0432100 [Oryza sativa Japonica Group]CAE03038.3 OSJNBa0084A10.13 [Oryza sativa Japonica Group]CAH66442.1 B0308C03.2 [Oryza sativa]
MNLKLSLAIDGGGGGDAAAAVAKKSKVVGGGAVVVDGVGSSAICGGDRGSRVRDRMVKKAEEFDHENGMAATSSDGGGGGGGGMELVRLLLSAVAAGEAGDARAAAAALREVDRRASCRGGGDPAQRVAACYAAALAPRLAAGLRPARSSPAAPAAARAEQFLAYTMFYQASPFYQFAHFTANQAIVEAFESGGRRRLHVVDFDVSYGFQWPSLIQSLSDAAAAATSSSSHDDDDNGGGCGDGPVSLRITGFGASADELRETEARLRRFAAGCPNLRFEFEGILNNGSNTRHDCTRIDDDATVVVNLVFPASSREACAATRMAYINSLNPSMVFLIEKHDGGGGLTGGDNTTTGRSASLLPRFAANLRYFAAVFDSLHECLPADSAERLAIERDHLGREIADAVASLDHQHRRRHGGGGGGGDHAAASWNWKAAMEGAGLDGVKLSSRTVSQAKLLLKMKSGCGGGGFRVVEGDGGMAMSLAWRDMALATATLWRRRRRRRRCR